MATNKHYGALPVGTVLKSPMAEYEITEVLGCGGFAITYKAKTTETIQKGNVTQSVDLNFAVKEFFMKGCERTADGHTMTATQSLRDEIRLSMQDFVTEARRLNKLGTESVNIVKVNEVFTANGTAYYVMEYLDGGSLEEYVQKNGAMTWSDAVDVLTPVAKAVALLHNERLLHLDIKPGNIMLKHASGGGTTPVLIDFGIAKHFGRDGRPTTSLNAAGASDGFAPMEQYADITKFSPETDVYALGATLYFMVSGSVPPKAFDVNGFDTIRRNIPLTVNEAGIAAIEHAMKPIKAERTQTVAAFLQDINCGDMAGTVTEDLEHDSDKRPKWQSAGIIAAVICAVAVVIVVCILTCGGGRQTLTPQTDTTAVKADTTGIIKAKSDSAGEKGAQTQGKQMTEEASTEADEQQDVTQHTAGTEQQQTVETPKRGTVSLGWATYTGGLRNGKPHGTGTLRFSSAHAIDSRDQSRVASSGDKVTGEFVDGHLSFGTWYKSSGETETVIIGE